MNASNSFFDADFVDVGESKPLGQRVPRKRIYCRACYSDFATLLFTSPAELLLIGSPGIGKSLFGLLFLLEFARVKISNELPSHFTSIECIVYEHRLTDSSKSTFFLIDFEVKKILEIEIEDAMYLCQLETTLLVKDGACVQFDVKCNWLWVTSPRPDAVRKLGQEIGVSTLYFPPVEVDELLQMFELNCAPEDLFAVAGDRDSLANRAKEEAEAHYDDDEDDVGDIDAARKRAVITRWAADLGPSARRVFKPVAGYLNLQGALTDLSRENYSKIVEIAESHEMEDAGEAVGLVTPRKVAQKFVQSHALLTMATTADYHGYTLAPVSQRVLNHIWNLKKGAELKDPMSLMKRLEGTRLGLVYEEFCHDHICRDTERGFSIEATRLGTQEKRTFNFGVLTKKCVANKDLDTHVLVAGEYYVPDDPTFPNVDAWTSTAMLQMTVNAKADHPIISGAKLFKKLKARGVPPIILYMVPKDLLNEYIEKGKQPNVKADGKRPAGGIDPQGGWNEIEQYVCGLENIR